MIKNPQVHKDKHTDQLIQCESFAFRKQLIMHININLHHDAVQYLEFSKY